MRPCAILHSSKASCRVLWVAPGLKATYSGPVWHAARPILLLQLFGALTPPAITLRSYGAKPPARNKENSLPTSGTVPALRRVLGATFADIIGRVLPHQGR